MAIAALVLGILGVLFSLIPCTIALGVPLGIIAAILGGLSLKHPGHEGKAKAGLILGIVACVIAILWVSAIVALGMARKGGRSPWRIDPVPVPAEAPAPERPATGSDAF